MYHSHVAEVKDVNAGLMGPMLVTARGRAHADGKPTDVDREFVVAFDELFENESWYLQENLNKYATDPKGVLLGKDPFGQPFIMGQPPHLGYYHLMESMNGFIYGNLPGLTMNVGERVRWYLMGTTNFEVHAPHWHGHSVVINHMRTDVAALLTMGMLIADMVPDNSGTWLFHCHVGPHMEGGMQALYTVRPRAVTTTQN
jgi:FtsP/CotA-like multicopper oxidase with cupredoxin domain